MKMGEMLKGNTKSPLNIDNEKYAHFHNHNQKGVVDDLMLKNAELEAYQSDLVDEEYEESEEEKDEKDEKEEIKEMQKTFEKEKSQTINKEMEDYLETKTLDKEREEEENETPRKL